MINKDKMLRKNNEYKNIVLLKLKNEQNNNNSNKTNILIEYFSTKEKLLPLKHFSIITSLYLNLNKTPQNNIMYIQLKISII
tara:strand:+ start:395 stop:640 length:246 start_codon:yes stop_codon:yes gene_type:complete